MLPTIAKSGIRSHRPLADIPLCRQMLEDPGIRFASRAIDARWNYEGLIPPTVFGFNPFHSTIYHAKNSRIAEWLKGCDTASVRRLNEADILVREVLFAAHDYLHCWSVSVINELAPEVGFGTKTITADNFEDMVFCLLATEAAATVGLDYWYLATIDLEEMLGIGTCVTGLTTQYREKNLDEFRRFSPEFTVQAPRFFVEMVRFYCTGRFYGFERDSLKVSPLTLRWLRHELSYGALQREYSREWLAFLAGPRIRVEPGRRRKAVDLQSPWKARVLAGLCERLWAKVKDDDPCLCETSIALDQSWTAPEGQPLDFRFTNLNAIDGRAVDSSNINPKSKLFHLYQTVSRIPLESVPDELLNLFPIVREREDASAARVLYSSAGTIDSNAVEPADLFFLN